VVLLLTPAVLAAPSFLEWQGTLPPAPEKPARVGTYGFAADLWVRSAAVLRAWPGRVRAEVFGRSVQGRPLWAFTVRDPTGPVEERVLVFAQLHAMEWIGAEVAVALLERIADDPVPGVETVIVPLANPDGRARAEDDLLAGDPRAWRRANANGVDLNRDFAVNRDTDVVWSRLPFTRGFYATSPAPLSQPETRALDALAARGIEASVSLHAFGGYIYYPWSGRWAAVEDQARLHELGTRMSQAQPHPYRTMQLCHWIFFFRALGSELDHMYQVHGADSFLIELTRSGITANPSTWRDLWRRYNPEPMSPHVEDGVSAILALLRHYSVTASSSLPMPSTG
jgi:hypothetical protein